ncbi:MAG: biopolymer transporter ExbD, partial [Sphingomonas sp.]|nr:biopolymer transporter ExbD [Sphingomonas sp.]
MAVSVGPGDGEDMETMSDINVVPLVDVMLVLLIIFLIAIPVVLQSVPVKLPAVRYEATTTKPENVNLTVRGSADGSGGCEVYWNLTKVDSKALLDRAVKKLEEQIEAVGGVDNITEENMPEAHIRGDVDTPYKCIGGAIYNMQRAGFARV